MGIVQLFYDSKWLPLCSNDVDDNMAATICKQLAYTGLVKRTNRYILLDTVLALSEVVFVLLIRVVDSAKWVTASNCSSNQVCLKDCFESHSLLSSSMACSSLAVEIECGKGTSHVI